MTQQLTPGKWRGLKQTSTGQNVFAILAFDQRGNYVKMRRAAATRKALADKVRADPLNRR